MKLILIPCGATDWRDSGRLLGRVELSLTDGGRAKCDEWAGLLSDDRPACIYHSSDELASETAARIAARLEVTAKSTKGLDEIDVGLWAGLTREQLKSRYESAYRQLCDAPLSVSAPEGETFSAAIGRITRSLRKQLKRNGSAVAGVVMRPLALAATRCEMEQRPMSEFWATSMRPDAPVSLDCSTRPAQATMVGTE